MAVKAISPTLTAYYEQVKHPMPALLDSLDTFSLHDKANMRFNDLLWEKVKSLSAAGEDPSMTEFRRMAADLRKSIDAELFRCDDPYRMSGTAIVAAVMDSQVGVSPINLGTSRRSNDPSRTLLPTETQNNGNSSNAEATLMASISISYFGLSKSEIEWLNTQFKPFNPSLDDSERSLILASTIQVDGLTNVDRWLPKRIAGQLITFLERQSAGTDFPLKAPLKTRLQIFLTRIF